MNYINLRLKIVISLVVAMLLSVVYLSSFWQGFMPPWVPMVLFYWLIFKIVPLNIWLIWLVGFLSGCLLGDPLGVSSFWMVLLAWPLLSYQRTFKFMTTSSCWLIWILVSVVYTCLKVSLMGLFGYVGLNAAAFKPILSTVIISPVIYVVLNTYAQLSFLGKRLDP
jgi:rod shape-determining protein MreD